MAIHQQRRENLLLEATAYSRRALFRIATPLAAAIESAAGESAAGRQDSVAPLSDRQAWLSAWLSPCGPSAEWELFVGLRADGGWSLYFDEQPVLQFNAADKLRRVFAGGKRYAAEQGRLKLFDRTAMGGHVSICQVELDELSQQRLRVACEWCLRAAADVLEPGRALPAGIVPSDDPSWLPPLQRRIRQLALGIEIAQSPRVGGDR